MLKREDIKNPALGTKWVFHDKIYNGKEPFTIVGIRETEIELEGDFSGGTHNVIQKDWFPIEGAFRMIKECEQIEKFGTCTLPNLFCNYPECHTYVSNY